MILVSGLDKLTSAANAMWSFIQTHTEREREEREKTRVRVRVCVSEEEKISPSSQSTKADNGLAANFCAVRCLMNDSD